MSKKTITYYLKALGKFLEITFICSAVVFACYFLLGQILEVSGDSMLPLIKSGQHLLAEKVSVKNAPLKRGEIIVFTHQGKQAIFIIKRVIGLPNETFKLSAGKILINGEVLEEPYLLENNKTTGGTLIKEGEEYTVPPDEYLVLGDNRAKSVDSREWGFAPKNMVLGRAVFVYKPLKEFKILLGH